MNRNIVIRKKESPVHKHIGALVMDNDRRSNGLS